MEPNAIMTHIGKQIGTKQYVHKDQLADLPDHIRIGVESAGETLAHHGLTSFNVVRVNSELEEFAFLHYPALGQLPFPPLVSSWRINVPTSRLTYRDYSESLNPPILHRTELLLPEGDPVKGVCATLTQQCERLGLFDNPAVIGFQRQWFELIQQKGYELNGFELYPIANATPLPAELAETLPSDASVSILRHLTALSRSTLSAPVQTLIRDGLLVTGRTFFDYGCGKGDDLAALSTSGFQTSGWDPYYKPDGERQSADVVNLGFVINVIEDLEERITALTGAYALTRSVLAVAAMLSSTQPINGRVYRDGVRTGRNTFQKYFTQAELQQFIETVLDEDAYPAAPGVFYVFRDHGVEQSYLLDRTSDRSRVARARLATISLVRAPRPQKAVAPRSSETPEALEYLTRLWSSTYLELGRAPDLEEMPDAAEASRLFGSPKRALSACLARHDAASLERAAMGRRDDILVMLALHFFERRRRFTQLERRLQRDIKALFGSYQIAEAKAHQLLFSIKDPNVIRAACEQAAALGLGWLEPEHSLQLHTSLVERLPAPLRVYIGCATALAGDLSSHDLVKAHIQSGKVTLLSFDSFVQNPLPALKSRIKVRLRDQDMDVYNYGVEYPPTLLYWKSRFINEEFPRYAEQLAFDESLAQRNVCDLSGHGSARAEFDRYLALARLEIVGFELRPSTDIPALDTPCGTHFRYRDFIECGDTWTLHRVDNTPRMPDTYNALHGLATQILDPVIDYFGMIKLTYGFASPCLTRHIKTRIEPRLDQHAANEFTRGGKPVCPRGGAAVDFIVENEDMLEVAKWIKENCAYDRIYYYGPDRPIHVSYSTSQARQAYEMHTISGRRIPRKLTF